MNRKKHVLEKVHHLVVGFVLTLKGIDKISVHTLTGAIILLFGLSIIAYFFYKIKADSTGNTLHIVVHLFEALALLFTAYIYYQDGKNYLQYVLLAASIGFFISVIIAVRKMYITQRS